MLDGVATRLVWTTPPYLLLDHASETFRDLLNLDRTTILVAVSVISAGVNGAISGLFAAAFDGVERRILKLGIALSALWIFSGGLMTLVYLSPPAGVVVGSLARGDPPLLRRGVAPRSDRPARGPGGLRARSPRHLFDGRSGRSARSGRPPTARARSLATAASFGRPMRS